MAARTSFNSLPLEVRRRIWSYCYLFFRPNLASFIRLVNHESKEATIKEFTLFIDSLICDESRRLPLLIDTYSSYVRTLIVDMEIIDDVELIDALDGSISCCPLLEQLIIVLQSQEELFWSRRPKSVLDNPASIVYTLTDVEKGYYKEIQDLLSKIFTFFSHSTWLRGNEDSMFIINSKLSKKYVCQSLLIFYTLTGSRINVSIMRHTPDPFQKFQNRQPNVQELRPLLSEWVDPKQYKKRGEKIHDCKVHA